MRIIFNKLNSVILVLFCSSCVGIPVPGGEGVQLDLSGKPHLQRTDGEVPVGPSYGLEDKGYIKSKEWKTCQGFGQRVDDELVLGSTKFVLLNPLFGSRCNKKHYRHSVKIEVFCQSPKKVLPQIYRNREVYWFYRGKKGMVVSDKSGFIYLNFVTLKRVSLQEELRISISENPREGVVSNPRLLFNKSVCI